MDKLLEVLANLINNNNKKLSKWPLIFAWLFFLFLIIVSSILILYVSNNSMFNHIWEASFYILAVLIFFYIIWYWEMKREEKNEFEVPEKLNELIKKVRNIFKDSNVKFLRKKPQNWWGRLFKFIKDESISVWYSFDMDTWNLENFWIYSDNKEVFIKLIEIFKDKDSKEDYKSKYTDYTDSTIIPLDSQNLDIKTTDEMIKLLENYIKLINSILPQK